MSETPSIVVCISTVSTKQQAQQIAAALIERGVAACVQIDGPIESHYPWDGKVCCDSEFRLLIKTSSDAATRMQDVLRENHPYEVPQIVLLESVGVNRDYALWVQDVVASGTGAG